MELPRICQPADVGRRTGLDKFSEQHFLTGTQKVERAWKDGDNLLHTLFKRKPRFDPEPMAIHAPQGGIDGLGVRIVEDRGAACQIMNQPRLPIQQALCHKRPSIVFPPAPECARYHR